MEKLDKPTLSRLLSATNIILKLVTLAVSKLDRSKETIFGESKNMFDMFVTFDVSSLSKPLILVKLR